MPTTTVSVEKLPRQIKREGSAGGPEVQSIGSFTIDMYTATVAFNFQGQAFESVASFAKREA
jgi:hypothetical protein